MSQSAQTRLDSYLETQPTIGHRQQEILLLLKSNQPLTAWEISDILDKPVYQVRPRLTELEKLGEIRSGGAKFQQRTQRSESLYWLVHKGQLELI